MSVYVIPCLLLWQSFREGRGRPHRDYSSRSEEKSHHGRGNIPPSRHLWVGNLPHNLSESALAHHFLQFGELESIAFQPGRSYAFINYRNEEEAFTAVKELQGYVIGGNPLKIEFAKAVSFVKLCLTLFCYFLDARYCICIYSLATSMESIAIQVSAL